MVDWGASGLLSVSPVRVVTSGGAPPRVLHLYGFNGPGVVSIHTSKIIFIIAVPGDAVG